MRSTLGKIVLERHRPGDAFGLTAEVVVWLTDIEGDQQTHKVPIPLDDPDRFGVASLVDAVKAYLSKETGTPVE
jgi:hypothetical protein